MIIKSLLFSLLLSTLSVIIVAYAPIEISLRETGEVYSPYRDEIDQLEKNASKGITPSESEYLSSLIEKNNRWFEEEHKEYLKNTSTNAVGAWKTKSNIVSPAIMLLWGVIFYFCYRRKTGPYALFVLVVPLILLIAQLMSMLEVVLISFAVLIVYFWLVINKKTESGILTERTDNSNTQ